MSNIFSDAFALTISLDHVHAAPGTCRHVLEPPLRLELLAAQAAVGSVHSAPVLQENKQMTHTRSQHACKSYV